MIRIAIVGPTAVGKSAVALAVARRIGGEVLNADAVQLYRGLDRGAAKLPFAEREGVTHHLLDVADPDQTLSVAVYRELAQAQAEEIERRGAIPIVCGGSGLYVRAALGEWTEFGTPPDPEFRRGAAAESGEELWARLRELDPAAAADLSPRDRPRLVRAIERQRAGDGAPIAQKAPADVLKVGLFLPRAELYRRIDQRADALWGDLLRETRELWRFRHAVCPALGAIGYREAAWFLGGLVDEPAALRLLRRNTRHLAKRQLTWWRHERDMVWLRPDDATERIAELCAAWAGRPWRTD